MITSPLGRKFIKKCTLYAAKVSNNKAVTKALIYNYISLMDCFQNDVVEFRKVECTMGVLIILFHFAHLNLRDVDILKRLRRAYERELRKKFIKLRRQMQKGFLKWHPNFADSDKGNMN